MCCWQTADPSPSTSLRVGVTIYGRADDESPPFAKNARSVRHSRIRVNGSGQECPLYTTSRGGWPSLSAYFTYRGCPALVAFFATGRGF
jgi:hypothetical protein